MAHDRGPGHVEVCCSKTLALEVKLRSEQEILREIFAEAIAPLSLQIQNLEEELQTLRKAIAPKPINQVWYAPKEAANHLGVSLNALRSRINDGTFPPYNRRTGKGCWVNVGKGKEKSRYKIHVPNANDFLNRSAS